jgi:hypothetical protein
MKLVQNLRETFLVQNENFSPLAFLVATSLRIRSAW